MIKKCLGLTENPTFTDLVEDKNPVKVIEKKWSVRKVQSEVTGCGILRTRKYNALRNRV